MMMMIMGHECIWRTAWGINKRGKEKGKDIVCYTNTYEDSIMKPPKHSSKDRGGGRGGTEIMEG
jgi:hypothetical protein